MPASPCSLSAAAILCMPLLACTEGVTAVLSWPSVQGAKSMLVIAQPAGLNPFGEAHELDPDTPINLQLGDGFEHLEVTALLYRYPLRSLGLAAGPLAFGDRRPLPIAGAIFHSSISAGASGEWEAIDSAPSGVQQLGLDTSLEEACNRWMRFTQHLLRIPGEDPWGGVAAAVSIDEESVLLATRSGRLFRATADEVLEAQGSVTSTTPYSYLGGLRTRAGDAILI